MAKATETEKTVSPDWNNVPGNLLKDRNKLFETIRQDNMFIAGLQLLLLTIILVAAYGFVMVMHLDLTHGLLISLKLPLVFIASILLTMPTLYVFSAIRGSSLSLREMVSSTFAGFGLTAILMVALLPIVWLFAYSNASEAFLKFLNFLFIGGSLIGGFMTINGAFKYISDKENPGAKGYKGIETFLVWTVLFLFVFAQMVANFGPFFTVESQPGLMRNERKSFMEVFFTTKDTDKDGLSDEKEKELKTNPKKKDTDGDGKNDKYEVDSYYDPLNAD